MQEQLTTMHSATVSICKLQAHGLTQDRGQMKVKRLAYSPVKGMQVWEMAMVNQTAQAKAYGGPVGRSRAALQQSCHVGLLHPSWPASSP